ncbi:MAG: hypothetical protein F9K48_04280 [Candidatus Brocadia sp.]|nr:MAG: hypothetical protein F9K48_04280 [Candidatus Brocadia sp.]
MKRLLLYLFIFFLFFPREKSHAYSNEFTIIFSGEELGNLEPCGCYEGQLGGIAKRYSFIDFFRNQKNSVLPISFGDLTKSCGRQDEIKIETLCRALGLMGYVLHNLGEKDIEINPQILSFLSQTQSVEFLSTNVNIDAPFPIKINQTIIKKCFDLGSPVKIAFLGILSKSLLGSNISEYITVSEPIKALKPFVKQLRNKVNLIVLLSHASVEESREIAKCFPDIGLIITGHNIEEPKDAITFVNNTPIVSSGMGGRYIGIARYGANKKTIERKSVEVIPLDHTYNDSQEMIALLQAYQHTLTEEDLLSKIPQAPLPNGLSYTGSFACSVCHKIIYDHWYKTTHAKAYNTLVGVGHQYDPECIKCHTTGYGDVSGFLNYEKNQNLINAGCESCHGAGNKHIKNVNDAYGSTDERSCEVCHDSEHSPKFQYKEYWKKIEHPKESLKKLPGK